MINGREIVGKTRARIIRF